MDRTQLDAAIRDANISGTRDDLIATLQALPDSVLFHSLFALASDTQINAPAYDASMLLLELNPTCPISCVDIVRNIAASDWDISIEELPWYVVKQFSRPAASNAIAAIRQESLTDIQSKTLNAIEYWVGLEPTDWPT